MESEPIREQPAHADLELVRDLIKDLMRDHEVAILQRFDVLFGALVKQLPSVLGDEVAMRLGSGWQKLGEERFRRAEAEDDARRLARAAHEVPIDRIVRRVVEALDTRDAQIGYSRTTGRRSTQARIDPRLLTLEQAGEYLGAPGTFAKKLITDGKLPAVQLYTVWKVDVADLDRLIAENRRWEGAGPAKDADEPRA